jgi:pimeloyl-ACP methyl ester carboxylesterase
MTAINYRTAEVDGLKIFYREAGRADGPTLLLLHGFPSAGHMFRDLIPLLAERFHLVAPDLPGFGQSDMPSRDGFKYTFDNLAKMIDRFTEVIGLERFAIYFFDYGAPVGLRIAAKHPERITAIVSQNGNAYEEGLSEGWNPIQAYWREPTQANRDALRSFLAPETTLFQYTHGVADLSLVSPDGRLLDDHYLARPGAPEAQLDLFLDYASKCRSLPSLPILLPESPAAVSGGVGQERPVLPARGCRSVQARHPGRRTPFFRHRPLRVGDALRGDCVGHSRLPRPDAPSVVRRR